MADEKQQNETLELNGIEAEMTFDPRRSKNTLHLKVEDSIVRVSSEDEELGSIGGCIGGDIEFVYRGMHWTIRPRTLWAVFQKAVDAYADSHPDIAEAGKGNA